MQGCPCGDLTHPERACRCAEAEVRRYRGLISGPLLDRIDLHVEVPPVPVADLRARAAEREGRGSESAAARELLERAAGAFRLSARAYHRMLRVARTIADLEGAEAVGAAHVSEALQYRAQGLAALAVR